MTITFKPTLQLHFNTLLAATSSQAQVVSGASKHYLLAAPAIASSSNSSGSNGGSSDGPKLKHSSQLAIWDGQHLLLCELHQGTDPSQRRIDQSLNARALLMYSSRSSSKQLEEQKQQLQQAEQQLRALTSLQPEPWGAPAESSCAALIKGNTAAATLSR
jgi:hypothetical protein